MKKTLFPFFYIILAINALNPLYSQEFQNTYTEEYSPAYQETSQTTSWSAYIPIAATVAAAAWFGWADIKQSSSESGHYDSLTTGIFSHY